ncbi:unnamed protein product [Rhizophagus irregularis]|nr:unnamed protein product [Rhizophagus irregularis]
MYKFLTGDPSALSNWTYLNNPPLKAKILAEIELFYLLPHQRRWKEWFPEVIHYHASMKKTRKEIKQMIENKEWKTKEFPNLKRWLTENLGIEDDALKGIHIE